MTTQEITDALFSAMARAGVDADGMVVEAYTDRSDGYYDYWGYRVDGPHRDRAAKWLSAQLTAQGKRHYHRSGDCSMAPSWRSIEVRPLRISYAGEKGSRDLGLLVCTGSAGLGD